MVLKNCVPSSQCSADYGVYVVSSTWLPPVLEECNGKRTDVVFNECDAEIFRENLRAWANGDYKDTSDTFVALVTKR